MVGADLEQLLAGALAQPACEALVQVGPRGFGETRVRDLADQDVLEAVGGLSRDRRAQLRDEELAQQQGVEHRIELVDLGCKFPDCAAPESPADHRGALEHGLLFRRQTVDTGRDQRLECVGNPLGELRQRSALAVREHANGLFDEEGVPLGLVQQRLEGLGIDRSVRSKRRDELLALLPTQRFELDRRCAQPAAAPAGADVE